MAEKPSGKTGKPGGGPGGTKPGSKDKFGPPDDRAEIGQRPRTQNFTGPEPDDSEPTRGERGLLEQGEDYLARLDKEIQAALSGPAQDITVPTERPGHRPPNDEERPRVLGAPSEEEPPPPLVPGDPNDLGARGRRRRTQDAVNQPPLLRRGLLGV